MKRLFLFLSLAASTTLSAQQFDDVLNKGDEFFNNEEYDKAVETFGAAIKIDPSKAIGYWYRGDAYRKSSKFDKAIEDYNKSLELDNTNASVWYHRGNSELQLKMQDKGCADLKKAHELNNTKAARMAGAYDCAWTKTTEGPCSNATPPKTSAEIDAFTGTIITSAGLKFGDSEFSVEDKLGYITGPMLGNDATMQIKLKDPENFCIDSLFNVHVGLQMSLFDDKGKEIFHSDDLYNSNEGFPSDMLSSLSVTLGFTELKPGAYYVMKSHFFDKRGKGKIYIEFPFKAAEKTAFNNETKSSSGTMGLGIRSSSVQTTVEKAQFRDKTTGEITSYFELKKGAEYVVELLGVKELNTGITFFHHMVDNQGKIYSDLKGAEGRDSSDKLSFELFTKDLPAGEYTTWIYIYDESERRIGITIPIYIKQ